MKKNGLYDNELVTDRLVLKPLDSSAYAKVLDYQERNKEHFRIALPEHPDNYFTEKFWMDRLWSEFKMMLDETSIRLYIFKKEDEGYTRVIGDISAANILRGFAQSCKIGYKLDKDETCNGYMQEALSAFVVMLFDEWQLHRLEVNIIPDNLPSLKLIRKLGFTEEGTAQKYLKIDGKWQDHIRFSKINPDYS